MSQKQMRERGFADDKINELYRTLFVHSQGLYEIICQICRSLQDHQLEVLYQRNIWRVFQILLENNNKCGYQMLVSQAEM